MAKGSSKGGGGGGDIDKSKVLAEEDMISARQSGNNQVATDQVLATSKAMHKQYGVDSEVGQFLIAKMSRGSRVLGYYDGKNIAINEKYMDAKKMTQSYDACVDSGYHPGRGNKTGIEAVTAHEFGHALTDAAARKIGGVDLHGAADMIVAKAMKANSPTRKAMTDFGSKISGYAKKNTAETISEAVADVYCNGAKANRTSKSVVRALKSYLK